LKELVDEPSKMAADNSHGRKPVDHSIITIFEPAKRATEEQKLLSPRRGSMARLCPPHGLTTVAT